ncbi:MAG: protein translocase subunit SecD, partial [Patescibacteria group bacterium]
MKVRFLALGLLIVGMAAGYFVYPRWGISESLNVPFRLGLDLKGGIHLIYRADLSQIESGQRTESLEGLRDVIERRVNFFGVSEPVVRTERAVDEDRLSVQLAGVFDPATAIQLIGETPYLEFKRENPNIATTTLETNPLAGWESTELTGRYLKSAQMEFDPTTGVPSISITFDDAGAKLFEDLTAQNIGKP